jgi:hypothetical protein
MVKQNEEDFKRHLTEQIHFLEKSTKEYDKGDFLEAKQMSVRLRVLLHDTPKSVSLLTHLGRKDIGFYDTSVYDENNLLFDDGLVCYKIEVNPGEPTKITFVPPLNNGPPNRYTKGKIPFDEWWTNTIIDDKQGNTLNRKKLILAVCNQDGGAHIDAKLKEAYANSMNKHNVQPITNGKDEGIFVSDIISANIRQITYEVLKSLKDEFSECFK